MRLVAVRPVDPAALIPIPGTASRLVAGRRVDVEAPYWAAMLAAGSIVECPDPAPGVSAVAPPPARRPRSPSRPKD